MPASQSDISQTAAIAGAEGPPRVEVCSSLFQSDEGLVPAFVIEEFDDGRYTVFVPSIPTPFAWVVYILDRHRVHPLDVPFTDAVKVVSRWGSGAKDLVAAMENGSKPAERTRDHN
jgi:uncharacterized membrane protein